MTRRLDEVLANAGLGSRRELRGAVLTGHVSVNGTVVRKPDTRVEESDEITLDGVKVDSERYIYLMMNKPCGYVSTTTDDDSLLVLVPDLWKRKDLFPVGRLDKDTSGLILITNDGAFAHKITSPNREVKKIYVASLAKPADENTVKAIGDGLMLRDGLQTKPAEVVLSDGGKTATVTVSEGKYHEVRRMFAACGNYVESLKRIGIGALALDLEEGKTRKLTKEEVRLFQEM